MHQHYQNKLTLQQEQKYMINLTEDRKFYNNTQYLLIKKNILTVSLLRIVSLFECFKTIPYEFIWILVLLLLQYGNFFCYYYNTVSATLAHSLVWCLLEGSSAFRGEAFCWYKLSVVGLTFDNHSTLKGSLI